MIQWLKQLKRAFGASFLWLICLIYFTQGFRSFVWTAVSYHLKDSLQLSPSASQFVSSVAFFPWSIKPLYGILSDCIPIRGKRRTPYLVISSVLSLLPWPILGLVESLRMSTVPLMIILTLQNVGSAMADVVADAMIAESVRLDRASFSGDLQSLSWLSMALGGICGCLLGGHALDKLPIDTMFLLFATLPALQLISCGLVQESPTNTEASTTEDLSLSNSNVEIDDTNAENGETYASGYYRRRTKRRKKNQKNIKKKASTSKRPHIQSKNNQFTVQWFYSFKKTAYSLYDAFRQPIIFRPMAWFFLAHVSFPNISTVIFYYETEVLKLDASFLGNVRVVGWLGLMLGTTIYNKFLKKHRLRGILMWTQIALSVLILIEMFIVSRLNIKYGISDKMMSLWGSALGDAINQFKFMPFLILSGNLCPPGIEGTLFALFMSINNLGATVGSFLGAGLASVLNISSGSFDNLLLGLLIQFVSVFIPVAFLSLIPKDSTGLSA